VLAIQFGVPAGKTFVTHPEVVLKALKTRFSFRVAGALFHAVRFERHLQIVNRVVLQEIKWFLADGAASS
jgi:hypothetical protein